jgi:argininosuccinate lyase
MTGIVSTLTVNEAKMRERLKGSLTVAVELAETLVTEAGLSFRESYKTAAALVRKVLAEGRTLSSLTPSEIDAVAQGVLGKGAKISQEHLDQATDPEACLMRRKSEGSPHPDHVRAMLQKRAELVRSTRSDLEARIGKVQGALESLQGKVASYSEG